MRRFQQTSLFLPLLLVLLVACNSQTNNYITEKVLYVASYTTSCVIDGQSRQCLVVADQPQGPYYTFFNTIEGFNYQPGFDYEILVRETLTVSGNTQQTYRYELIRIVAQTPVGGGTATPTPTPTATPPAPGGDFTTYVVRPGDTLNEIAFAFGIPRSQIICINDIRNINQIEVGQPLFIPLQGNYCEYPLYIVQQGDTLGEIAVRFGLSVFELASFNGIANVNSVEAGDVLYIPPPGTVDPRQ